MRNNITYGVDPFEGIYFIGLVFARYKDRIAYFDIVSENTTDHNAFQITWKIVDCTVAEFAKQDACRHIDWTRKVDVKTKNMFRKHFGLKPLPTKED